MNQKCLIVLLLLCICVSALADSDERLLLAGGHLPICSSVAPKACVEPQRLDEDAYRQAEFQVDESAVARLLEHDDIAIKRLGIVLGGMLVEMGEPSTFNKSALAEQLDRRFIARSGNDVSERVVQYGLEGYQARFPDDPAVLHGGQLLDGLSDMRYAAALSLLEKAPTGKDRRREQVRLDDSSSQHALAVMQRFLEMARSRMPEGVERPRIAFSTASSHDSFEAVDFYQQLFDQLGADAVWLPLDRSVMQARIQGRCDALEAVRSEVTGLHRRAAVYPDLAARQRRFCSEPDAGLAVIDSAQALFFNGGDQSFTRSAWLGPDGTLASPELERLRQRFNQGAIAVGGTSAGTAVQADVDTPMISNGDALTALFMPAIQAAPPAPGCQRDDSCSGVSAEQMTWWQDGGLGFFAHGLIDTHFSERLRELRMLMLAAQTGQAQAWGVDETTALVVSDQKPTAVVGAGGAWQLHSEEPPALKAIESGCQVGPARVSFYANDPVTLAAPVAAGEPPEACYSAEARFDLGEAEELRASVMDWLNDGHAADYLIASAQQNDQTARICWYRDQDTQVDDGGYRQLNMVAILSEPQMC